MHVLKKVTLCLGFLTLLHAEEGVSMLVQKGIELESYGYNKDALVLYTKAQENGDLLAMAFVGKMYLGGWGVKKDACRAVDDFELVISLAQSDKEIAMLVAKVGLASAYAEGDCVLADGTKALELIKEVLFANGASDHAGMFHLENLQAGDFYKTPLRKEYIGLALYLLGNQMDPRLSLQKIRVDILEKAAEFGNRRAKRELQTAGLRPPGPSQPKPK
ncbi:hypothetical protein HHE02_07540 [Helicobacter heilmannii]|uniref:Uncharacterized protein n=1 Tax=Helicobacter heilmannii TaxID=35817 RepID=A0A0K2XX83_HELHE|nr:sel1 repeat family protein [Helicobacter heilmannii]CCM11319.1 hypothetical protein BN341_14430 [Helicobacter heilmannii ASB1.4]CRF46052.1 hypothetical protein HHE014_10400 [Helicobacter heilmannii]CRF47463.1 hypothetical protein HHE02_07540 [Helicobacter heilmannii]CRF48669.1 hypothetical protein HHE03_02420 [Helicobacter heilmannii]CRF50692.1 hypothetical protein HHE06_05330 [Helicobacter heilmannii]